MSSEELWKLMRATHEVTRLVEELRLSDAAGTTTPEQERLLRLRRATLAQQHLEAAERIGSDPVEALADAERTATLLWKHDSLHGSHRGALPATDPAWRASNVQAYVRQEAAAAGLTD